MPADHTFSPSRRRTLAWLGGTLGSVLAGGGGRAAAWKTVNLYDREYVTAKDIAAFYRFDKFEVLGRDVWFRSPSLVMKLETESLEIMMNNTKFVLSNNVLVRDGEVLVSRLDLAKLIDPVLRPGYLRTAKPFTTVVVDPGHGGDDTGFEGRINGVKILEPVFALDVGLKLRDELVKRGFKVVMTRETDVRLSLDERARIGHETSDSILVSIHFNGGARMASGIETYAMSPRGTLSTLDAGKKADDLVPDFWEGNLRDGENIALAAAVHSSVMRRMQMIDRGIRRARHEVLRETGKPGILIEGGYMTHPGDAARLNTPEYRSSYALAIAEGVVNYQRAISQ